MKIIWERKDIKAGMYVRTSAREEYMVGFRAKNNGYPVLFYMVDCDSGEVFGTFTEDQLVEVLNQKACVPGVGEQWS